LAAMEFEELAFDWKIGKASMTKALAGETNL
jgi:hypothetical protein